MTTPVMPRPRVSLRTDVVQGGTALQVEREDFRSGEASARRLMRVQPIQALIGPAETSISSHKRISPGGEPSRLSAVHHQAIPAKVRPAAKVTRRTNLDRDFASDPGTQPHNPPFLVADTSAR
ncbi:hypothetical protein [Amycolatopsis sp. cmx-11-51]|uniref:hypothetical protein n=1 Tax=unclassified Amycolatopsis TaxID=2618356 RepID=UPI0039E5A5EA